MKGLWGGISTRALGEREARRHPPSPPNSPSPLPQQVCTLVATAVHAVRTCPGDALALLRLVTSGNANLTAPAAPADGLIFTGLPSPLPEPRTQTPSPTPDLPPCAPTLTCNPMPPPISVLPTASGSLSSLKASITHYGQKRPVTEVRRAAQDCRAVSHPRQRCLGIRLLPSRRALLALKVQHRDIFDVGAHPSKFIISFFWRVP